MEKIQKIMMTIVLVVTVISSTKAEYGNRGMGIWQELSVAKNFSDPVDHHNFLKYGGVFNGMEEGLVYGTSKDVKASIWKEYKAHTKQMAEVSLSSLVAALQYITLKTGNSLGGYISNQKALDILLSDMITVGDMPTDTIVFDTYNQNTDSVGTHRRPRHKLLKVGQWEQCLFINIVGYEPIPIRSTFCGNNIAQETLEKFIIKKKTTIILDEVIDPKPIAGAPTVSNGCTTTTSTMGAPTVSNGCTTTTTTSTMGAPTVGTQKKLGAPTVGTQVPIKINTPAVAPKKVEQPVQQKTQSKVEWSIVTD